MIRRTIMLLSLLASLVAAWLFFVPRQYPVHGSSPGPGIKYWQLSTGSRIAYTHISSGTEVKAAKVIYLHGGPGGHIRADLVKALMPLGGQNIDLYLYDQFGGGSSGRASDITDYTVDRHVADLKEIVDSMRSDKVVLIGQSWGAILASIFASRYPDKIERMILTCPGPVFPVKQQRAGMPAPDSIHLTRPVLTNAMGNKMTQNLRMDAVECFASRFGWTIATDREADDYAAWSGYYVDRSTVCDTANMPSQDPGHGYYAGLRTFKSLTEVKDYRDALKNCRFPVMVLKGECDNQPWGYTSEYLEIFPNSALKMIQGAGHFLWIERPDELRQLIQQFLARPE